jgi:hypothetical protein
MNVETIVTDVKERVEPVFNKGQDVATLTFETVKQSNQIVFDGAQELVKTNVEAGKDLFSAAKVSFEKAKTDGVKAVASSPIDYLPAGKDRVIAAYNDSLAVVTKTGEELVKVWKKGYGDVNAVITGNPVAAAAKKAKTTAKKTVKKAAGAAKKAAAQ